MRKIKFLYKPLIVISLLVLFAVINLLSSNFEKNPFDEKNIDDVFVRYEGMVPSYDYTAELVYGEMEPNFDGANKKIDSIVFTSGTKFLFGGLLWNSNLGQSNEVMYSIEAPDDTCSLIIKYPDYVFSDFKQLFGDYLLYSGARIDTLNKPSYRLVVSDDDMLEKYRVEFIGKNRSYNLAPNKDYLCLKMDTVMNLSDDVLLHDMLCLCINLRDFYNVPVLYVDDYLQKCNPFLLDKEFYSAQKSVEEIQDMLLKYGISMEETGEQMMVLTCTYDKPITKESLPIRYEGKTTEYGYKAEFKYGKHSATDRECLFSEYSKVKNPIVNESRRNILEYMINVLEDDLDDNVMHNVKMFDEECSFAVEFEKNTLTNEALYETMIQDMVKYAGINADTIYQTSYKLVISDKDKFDSISSENIYNSYSEWKTYLKYCEGYYHKLYSVFDESNNATKIEGLQVNTRMFLRNLQTAHGVPVLMEYDSIYNRIIKLHPDFYSEAKSVEELQVMLSEYGMSLEPTGEEMMVVTFTADKLIMKPIMFKNQDFKTRFFLLMIWGIFTCIMAAVPVRKESLAPFRLSVKKTIFSVFMWLVAAFFFMLALLCCFDTNVIAAIFESIDNIDKQNFMLSKLTLLFFVLGYIVAASGIMLFTYRKNYYSAMVKFWYVIYGLNACVFHYAVFCMIAFNTLKVAVVMSLALMIMLSLVLHSDKLDDLCVENSCFKTKKKKKLPYIILLLIAVSLVAIFIQRPVGVESLENVDETAIKREIWNSVNGLGNSRRLKAYVGLINTDNAIDIVTSFEKESGKSIFKKIMSNSFLPKDEVEAVLKNINDTLCRAFEKESMYVKDYKSLIDGHIEYEINKDGKMNSEDIDEDMVTLNMRYDAFKSNNIEYLANGVIDEDFNQGRVGDCWLIAALNSLRLTEEGREMLSDIISLDSLGNVKVILKGVDREYIVTPEELTGSDELAKGDLDVRAIEIAVVRFLHEIQDHLTNAKINQNKINGIKIKSNFDINDGMEPLSVPYYLIFNMECSDNIPVDDDLMVKIKSENYIVLAASSRSNEYILDSFSKHHVYSIVSADNEYVYMYNPYDIDNLQKMLHEDFMRFFDHAYSYELKK